MESFDFIDISAKGYSFAWKNRGYLARVVAPVLFVKITCLLAVFVLGASDLYLRQGLISMPGFILEAIFVIALIRYLVYNEPIFIWGKAVAMPESDEAPLANYNGHMSKKQAMQGGIAIYLLMRVVELLISGWEKDYLINKMPKGSLDTSPMESMDLNASPLIITILIMFVSMLIFIWTFRFFWLFIPVAMGCSFSDFLKKTSLFKTSLSMIATWMVCSLPLILCYAVALEILTSGLDEASAVSIIIKSLLQSIAEIVIVCVQVSAMTYAVIHILSSKVSK